MMTACKFGAQPVSVQHSTRQHCTTFCTASCYLVSMGSLTFTNSSIQDLDGQVFIVTGGNSGVGYETSLQLALHNGHVIVATHPQDPDAVVPADAVDGPGAVSKIKAQKGDAKVEYMELDLASFKSIDKFVKDFQAKGLQLYCLINNAGVQTIPDATTAEGLEVTLGVNFYGPMYLTQLLVPTLQQAARGPHSSTRIVWNASPEETLGETLWDDLKGLKRGTNIYAYGTSKLWMIMASMELNERLKGTGVESFACHPGMARTDLFRKGDHDKMATIITDWAQWVAGQTAASGALSVLYCATAPELEGKGGTYYGAYYKGPFAINALNTSARTPGNPETHDPALRARLYNETLKIIREVAAGAGVTVPEPMDSQPEPLSTEADIAMKAQQAERVAHAAAAPAGVSV